MSADSKITGMSHDGSEEDDINEIKASKPVSRARRFVPLAVGIAAVAAVGIGLYFFMDNNDIALANKSQSENFQGTVTAAELAEHNTEDDCWLLIHGTVYDLTEYAPKHPGGARVITDLAGTDASAEYDLEHPVSLLTTIPETIVGTYVGGSLSVSNEDDDGEGSDDNVGEETVIFTPTSPPEGQTSEGVDNGQSSVSCQGHEICFLPVANLL
jgi:cytochrome b involved in lipid metabolism